MKKQISKNLNKVFSLFIVITMMMGMLATTALAEEESSGEEVEPLGFEEAIEELGNLEDFVGKLEQDIEDLLNDVNEFLEDVTNALEEIEEIEGVYDSTAIEVIIDDLNGFVGEVTEAAEEAGEIAEKALEIAEEAWEKAEEAAEIVAEAVEAANAAVIEANEAEEYYYELLQASVDEGHVGDIELAKAENAMIEARKAAEKARAEQASAEEAYEEAQEEAEQAQEEAEEAQRVVETWVEWHADVLADLNSLLNSLLDALDEAVKAYEAALENASDDVKAAAEARDEAKERAIAAVMEAINVVETAETIFESTDNIIATVKEIVEAANSVVEEANKAMEAVQAVIDEIQEDYNYKAAWADDLLDIIRKDGDIDKALAGVEDLSDWAEWVKYVKDYKAKWDGDSGYQAEFSRVQSARLDDLQQFIDDFDVDVNLTGFDSVEQAFSDPDIRAAILAALELSPDFVGSLDDAFKKYNENEMKNILALVLEDDSWLSVEDGKEITEAYFENWDAIREFLNGNAGNYAAYKEAFDKADEMYQAALKFAGEGSAEPVGVAESVGRVILEPPTSGYHYTNKLTEQFEGILAKAIDTTWRDTGFVHPTMTAVDVAASAKVLQFGWSDDGITHSNTGTHRLYFEQLRLNASNLFVDPKGDFDYILQVVWRDEYGGAGYGSGAGVQQIIAIDFNVPGGGMMSYVFVLQGTYENEQTIYLGLNQTQRNAIVGTGNTGTIYVKRLVYEFEWEPVVLAIVNDLNLTSGVAAPPEIIVDEPKAFTAPNFSMEEVVIEKLPELELPQGLTVPPVTPGGEIENIPEDEPGDEPPYQPPYVPPYVPPTVELDFPEVPLAELEELDFPEVPLAELPEELEELDFPEVPLAGMPPVETVELDFPEVPLAEMPRTGVTDMLLVLVLGLGLSLAGFGTSATVLIRGRKKD